MYAEYARDMTSVIAGTPRRMRRKNYGAVWRRGLRQREGCVARAGSGVVRMDCADYERAGDLRMLCERHFATA
jgi:hypothetical protein